MSTFKQIPEEDVIVTVTELNQIVDVLGNTISGSGNTVQTFNQLGTSGTFQTVYDADITSITANKIFDITYGQSIYSKLTGTATKDLEVKQEIYRQFAQNLLGSADDLFTLPFLSSSEADQLHEAIFIGVKRLFHRDKILENTTTLNLYGEEALVGTAYSVTDLNFGNPNITPLQGEVTVLFSGTADTATPVGLAFLEQGVYVLDASRSFDGSKSTTIDGTAGVYFKGPPLTENPQQSVLSATSIDGICSYIRETRFQSGSTGVAFNIGMEWQNVTRVNSSIFSTEIGFEDFNLSSNPTFVDSTTSQIRTLQSVNGINSPTTFITAIGLHDAAGNLLAVGKPSRPIRNSRETRYIFNLRLDF